MSILSDFHEAMNLMGFEASDKYNFKSGDITCSYKGSNLVIRHGRTCYATSKIGNAIKYIECTLQVGKHFMPIMAAINTKNLAQNMIRVKSSNVWSIGFNVRKQGDNTGDLVMQFKNKNGGAGDIYIYYDVDVKLYRRMQSAPSVGHFFWEYIRNNHMYAKLTGNKHGVLPNAVN